MSENKFETAVGMCVIALTRYIMEKCGLNQEDAYKKLVGMELYKLLNDQETNMYLEPNAYLCEVCEKELSESVDAMYEFINR